MTKRQRAEIDEDAIRRMMSGDIPRVKPPTPQVTTPPDETPVAKLTEVIAKEPESQPRSKKTRSGKSYAELFLHKREGEQKRQTYISLKTHIKLTEVLAVIANDISVPTFIENVLTLHLEQYGEEINELYGKQFKKPF